MPTYDYTCKKHGSFTATASIANFDAPSDCPDCGKSAPRDLISAPQIATSGGRPTSKKEGLGQIVRHHPGGCGCGC